MYEIKKLIINMGAYRSQPDKMKITYQQNNGNLEFAVCHMCGWRLYMEDTTIEQLNFDGQNKHFFGIFDGHGGAEVAIFTRNHFVQELLKNKNYLEKNYKQALEQTFQKIDKLLKTEKGYEQIKHIQSQLILEDNLPKRDYKESAGCTALICLLSERSLLVSNAGDSRAFAKKNGEFVSLNHIHTPLVPEEKKRIQRAGGFVNDEGRIDECLNVSRSIGDLDFKNNRRLSPRQQKVISFPQVHRESLQGVEYILMGCDGIWQEKQPQEIKQFIDKKMNNGLGLSGILVEMFDWLICKEQEAEEKVVGKDNMTAILIRFNHHSATCREYFQEITTQETIQY